MKEVWVVNYYEWSEGYTVDSVWANKGAADIRVRELQRNPDSVVYATRYPIQG